MLVQPCWLFIRKEKSFSFIWLITKLHTVTVYIKKNAHLFKKKITYIINVFKYLTKPSGGKVCLSGTCIPKIHGPGNSDCSDRAHSIPACILANPTPCQWLASIMPRSSSWLANLFTVVLSNWQIADKYDALTLTWVENTGGKRKPLQICTVRLTAGGNFSVNAATYCTGYKITTAFLTLESLA